MSAAATQVAASATVAASGGIGSYLTPGFVIQWSPAFLFFQLLPGLCGGIACWWVFDKGLRGLIFGTIGFSLIFLFILITMGWACLVPTRALGDHCCRQDEDNNHNNNNNNHHEEHKIENRVLGMECRHEDCRKEKGQPSFEQRYAPQIHSIARNLFGGNGNNNQPRTISQPRTEQPSVESRVEESLLSPSSSSSSSSSSTSSSSSFLAPMTVSTSQSSK